MVKNNMPLNGQDYIIDTPDNAENSTSQKNDAPIFIYAHGAGAPMDSVFMDETASLMAKRGIKVVRFEFPYMKQRRIDGIKRPPNKADICIDAFKSVIEDWQNTGPIFIGGKSMGGRIASILAAHNSQSPTQEPLPIKGVCCIGYPFHPPKKKDKWRTDHFSTLTIDTLILQGDRDPFGSRLEIEDIQNNYQYWPIPLNENKILINWVSDGDHDLKPRKRSGFTHEGNKAYACDKIASFIINNTNV